MMYFSSVCYKKYVLFGKKSFNNIQSLQLAAFSKCITKKEQSHREPLFHHVIHMENASLTRSLICIQLLLCVRINVYICNILILWSCLKSLYT